MSEIVRPATLDAAAAPHRSRGAGAWVWLLCLVVAILLPWAFYNWTTGRHSGFMISMLSQTVMMIIFALSYNMLMGQAGLLSFCHAVFFGIGGYTTIHALTAAGKGTLPVPMELVPVIGGLAGL